AAKPRRAICATSVRMRREDRSPSRLILSQTSTGKPLQSSSLSTPAFELFLCSRLAVVPSSRPARAERRRAQRPSSLPVVPVLRLATALPGDALTAPRTARGSSGPGRHRIALDALEGAPLVENRPGDAGELVGERNREHVVVQSLLRRLDPRPEPIALPMLWPDLYQHDPGCLNKQSAQIAIAAL